MKVIFFLVGYFSFAFFSQVFAAPPASAVKIDIKRVDASRFPEVDVYFTVIDNVPGTGYYDLESSSNTYSLTVKESLVGEGSFSTVSAAVQGSETLPMVASLSIDRSGSMADVFGEVLKAAKTWVSALDSCPGDQADLVFFSGSADGTGIYHSGPKGSSAELIAFCDSVGNAGGMTPMFLAWNVSMGAVEVFDEKIYPVRAAITLTDGYDTCSSRSNSAELSDVCQVATSLNLPFFTIAFPRVEEDDDGNLSIGCDVDQGLLSAVAGSTDACYFEPQAPYPKLPETPQQPSGSDGATPIGDDAQVRQYFITLLTTLQNVVTKDSDARDAFDTDFKANINRVLNEDNQVADWEEFANLERDSNGYIVDSVMNIDGTDGIESMEWSEFSELASNVKEGAINTVTEADIANFYNIQMANMFQKIRQSLKKEYHLTFTSPNTRLDGKIRDIDVRIAYTTDDCGSPVTLTGSSTARYVAPLVWDEDIPLEQISTMDPASPVANTLFGSGAAPRGGTWVGDTSIDWGVELMARDDEGNPWCLASMTPSGEITVNDDATSPFNSVDAADVTTFLKHVDMVFDVDVATGKLTQKMVAFIPTCIAKDRADPQADWPLGNEEAVDFRKSTLWYIVKPVARRNYIYNKIVPTYNGGGISVTTEPNRPSYVKEDFPPLITYIYDSTSPTVSLFVSPSRGEINRIEAIEIDMDSETKPRPMTVYLYGKQWDPSYTELFDGYRAQIGSNTVARADWPLSLLNDEDNPVLPSNGIFVYEGQRLELNILCADNYDRAKDLGYMGDPENIPAPHNSFSDSDVLRKDTGTDHWPFLAQVAFSEVGNVPGYAAKVIDDGVESDLGSWHIFRTTNFPTGVDRSIVVKASDKAGNVSSIEVPVYVMPLGFNSRELNWKSNKNN
jgi:hypothetical protein